MLEGMGAHRDQNENVRPTDCCTWQRRALPETVLSMCVRCPQCMTSLTFCLTLGGVQYWRMVSLLRLRYLRIYEYIHPGPTC